MVLYADTAGGSARVYAVPAAGGARSEVFRSRAFGAALGLSASPQRAVLNIAEDGETSAFTWPLAGEWTELETFFGPPEDEPPYRVDGPHVIARDETLTVDGAPALKLPADVDTFRVAGDLVAYAQDDDLIVRNWRTGATVRTLPFSSIQAFALRPDARVAV